MRYGLNLIETIICFALGAGASYLLASTRFYFIVLTAVFGVVFMLLLIFVKTLILGKK